MQTFRRFRPLIGVGLLLWLAACGQPPQSTAESDPYANGTSAPWTYQAPVDQVAPLSLTPGENTLQYEPLLTATNAWGPVEKNTSNGERNAGDGRTLTLNGRTYAQGYGVHAGSELRFSLKGKDGAQCTRFTVDLGVDDEVGSRGSVIFQVFLDGTKAYDSGTMTGTSATKTADLNLRGKAELRLVVTDADNGISYDHADWANPKVLCQTAPAAPQVKLTLDRTDLTVFHKLTGSVKATFTTPTSFRGALDLRLVPDAPVAENTLPVELRTTRIDVTTAGPLTRDIVIAAPRLPATGSQDDASLQGAYRLVASINGQDVASVPLALTEGLLQVSAYVTPDDVPARSGETVKFKLTMSVTPPLPAPISLNMRPYATSAFPDTSFMEVVSVGATTGTGGLMSADVMVRFKGAERLPVDNTCYPAQGSGCQLQTFLVTAEDIAGENLPYYGSQINSLIWRIVR